MGEIIDITDTVRGVSADKSEGQIFYESEICPSCFTYHRFGRDCFGRDWKDVDRHEEAMALAARMRVNGETVLMVLAAGIFLGVMLSGFWNWQLFG